MTKKNIQVILAIVVLTLLSVGGLYYFSQQQQPPAPTMTQEPTSQPLTQESKVVSVDFEEDGSNVHLVVSDVLMKNYRVRIFEAGNGFSILFPNATLDLADKELIKPHPWIHSVSFEQKVFRGQNSVEMTASTIEGLALFDRLSSNTLTIELQNTKAGVASETQEKKAQASKATKKPEQKSTPPKSVAPKPIPKPTKPPEPAPKPQAPEVADQEDIWQEEEPVALGNEFDSPTSDFDQQDFDTNDTLTVFESDESSFESNFEDWGDLNEMSPISDAELSVMDLETGFSMGDDSFNQGSSEDVAAITPDDGRFDMGVAAQISLVKSMDVQTLANGRTNVVFEREDGVPFKIFRMVNPNRIVVDFKDAEAGFEARNINLSGTSIDKVETMKFESNDGALLRVMMYVKSEPEYSSRKAGSQLIVELP